MIGLFNHAERTTDFAKGGQCLADQFGRVGDRDREAQQHAAIGCAGRHENVHIDAVFKQGAPHGHTDLEVGMRMAPTGHISAQELDAKPGETLVENLRIGPDLGPAITIWADDADRFGG